MTLIDVQGPAPCRPVWLGPAGSRSPVREMSGVDLPPPVPWLREGELKRCLGTGSQSKISSERAKMVGKEWEGGL